jgi:hypothetical protein
LSLTAIGGLVNMESRDGTGGRLNVLRRKEGPRPAGTPPRGEILPLRPAASWLTRWIDSSSRSSRGGSRFARASPSSPHLSNIPPAPLFARSGTARGADRRGAGPGARHHLTYRVHGGCPGRFPVADQTHRALRRARPDLSGRDAGLRLAVEDAGAIAFDNSAISGLVMR